MQQQVIQDRLIGIQKMVYGLILVHANANGQIPPLGILKGVGWNRFPPPAGKLPHQCLGCKPVADIGIIRNTLSLRIQAPLRIPQFCGTAIQDHQCNGHSLLCTQFVPASFTNGGIIGNGSIEGNIRITGVTCTHTELFSGLQTVDHVHVIPGILLIFICKVPTLSSAIG